MEIRLGARRRSRAPLVLVILVGLGLGLAGAIQLRAGGAPALSIELDRPGIGPRSSLTIEATEPGRGVAHVAVVVRQGDTEVTVFDRSFGVQPAYAPWSEVPAQGPRVVAVGAEAVPGLVEGEATIEVTASGAATLLRSGARTTETWTGPVLLRPPRLIDLSSNTWVARGGAEAVVYAVGDTAARHGVRVGALEFPGHRAEALGPGQAFAFFVAPHDLEDPDSIRLFAVDAVGNRAEISFVDRYERRPLKRDTIRITDRVMEAVVPEIMANEQLEDRGTLLDNYLQINGDLRARLAERLIELSRDTAERFLWSGAFVQMPAQVVSSFADRRTYTYEGRPVDQQDHLGFDLASVAKDRVPAANDGRVVLAEYFGIYGNTVILDHGYGLMTLYAHLSRIDVRVGETVVQGAIVGRTGATGLALGDHLHFTTMIYGVPTTPLEWWDGHWIRDRIASKLEAILPGEEG